MVIFYGRDKEAVAVGRGMSTHYLSICNDQTALRLQDSDRRDLLEESIFSMADYIAHCS